MDRKPDPALSGTLYGVAMARTMARTMEPIRQPSRWWPQWRYVIPPMLLLLGLIMLGVL